MPALHGAEAEQQPEADGFLDRIYAVLSEVQPSGCTDTAARHDDHAA
jgi:hypothetical protein